jgi:hypothetical protein
MANPEICTDLYDLPQAITITDRANGLEQSPSESKSAARDGLTQNNREASCSSAFKSTNTCKSRERK